MTSRTPLLAAAVLGLVATLTATGLTGVAMAEHPKPDRPAGAVVEELRPTGSSDAGDHRDRTALWSAALPEEAGVLLPSGLAALVDLPDRFQVPTSPGLRPLPVVLVAYSRHDSSDPLALPNRRVLFEAIATTPGLSLAQLSSRTDVPVSTVRYHSRILAEEGLIRTATVRGRHRAFPTTPDVDDELAAALVDGPTRAVLGAVIERGPLSVSELATAVDRAPSTVSYHVDRLEDAGAVVRERAGTAVHVSATAALALPDGGRDRTFR